MSPDDLPMISEATDSTRIDLPAKAAKPALPAPHPSPKLSPPPFRAPAPAATPEPRKGTELRRPPTASVPAVKPAPPPAPSRDDEDPEKLLKEYADRQKTKVTRLEGELAEVRKAAGERDQYRLKWEAASRDLQDARAKLEAASKTDAVIKDLQGKLDAAILSNAMHTDEIGKLKSKVQELAAAARKFEEKAAHAEKAHGEAARAHATEKEARRDAEARIAAAAQALQPRPSAAAAPPAKK